MGRARTTRCFPRRRTIKRQRAGPQRIVFRCGKGMIRPIVMPVSWYRIGVSVQVFLQQREQFLSERHWCAPLRGSGVCSWLNPMDVPHRCPTPASHVPHPCGTRSRIRNDNGGHLSGNHAPRHLADPRSYTWRRIPMSDVWYTCLTGLKSSCRRKYATTGQASAKPVSIELARYALIEALYMSLCLIMRTRSCPKLKLREKVYT
jgi:hypothetical protein